MSEKEEDSTTIKGSRYPLTYKVELHTPPITVDEITEDPDRGGCDAVIIHSIIYPPAGGISVVSLSRNYTDAELTALEQWKVWLLVASELSEREDLPGRLRSICEAVLATVRSSLPSPGKDKG